MFQEERVNMFQQLNLPTQLSLDHIRTILEKLPRDGSEKTVQENLSLIERIGQPSTILPIFDQIISDKALCADIAKRSYRHVNHFDKIVLIDSENEQGYRLTLHFWLPPYTEKELHDELIHDHRFSFWSNILTGDLLSENFIRAEVGKTYQQYQYVPEKHSLSNFYTFKGEFPLSQTAPGKKTAGQFYYLSYERIHRVLLPKTAMTCTLVLRGPRQRNYSNVYNTQYPKANTQIANTSFSASQLITKLTVLSQAVAKRFTQQ
jgi:hypothetical protein